MAERPDNHLLRQLPAEAFDLLAVDLRTIKLDPGVRIYEPEDTVDRVIFPESGLLSVISVMESGAMAETSIVGRDGAVGYVEACGSGKIFSRVVVQGPGRAWVAPASRHRAAYNSSKAFRVALATSVELQLAEGRQNLACASLHRADQRLARWMLDCVEKSGGGDVLWVTQELLSVMVVVQRTTISALTTQFESEGLIRQLRGRVEITDPEGLAQRACECRRTIADLRERIQPEF